MIRIDFRTRPTCWVEVLKWHGVNKLVDVRYLERNSLIQFGLGWRREDDTLGLAITEGCRTPDIDDGWDPEDLDPDFLDREFRTIHVQGLVLWRNQHVYLVEITHIRDARYSRDIWYPVAMFADCRSMHRYLRPPESP